MQYPFFYEAILPETKQFILSEESSRHIVQVLRMKEGDKVQITDGKGNLLTVEIISANKKKVTVTIQSAAFFKRNTASLTLAVSLVKNTGRFEWFLEKATEIGVNEIIPLLCQRTEKSHLREDRMKVILVSAMLQSRQVWLPELKSPVKFRDFLNSGISHEQKFIAHCIEGHKIPLKNLLDNPEASKIILIGPEGDFSKEEIEQALMGEFQPVSLGENRLRTETAALVAAVLLKIL